MRARHPSRTPLRCLRKARPNAPKSSVKKPSRPSSRPPRATAPPSPLNAPTSSTTCSLCWPRRTFRCPMSWQSWRSERASQALRKRQGGDSHAVRPCGPAKAFS
ncbi:UNVERIFIED_CONTAM: hypothetical protein GTU68_013057 [Idotea baltica]|nr:hypothetical protein [Idotea baltica]